MKYKELIIIDGYNILNAWEKYNSFLKLSFENARNELIFDMGEFSKLINKELLLVFDAYKINSIQSKEKIKGIDVVYTKQNETADQYIEKKMDKLGKKILITVATDDILIQKLVTQREGLVLTSKELLYRYENLKNKITRLEKKNRITNKSYINTLSEENLEKLQKIEKKLFGK